MLLKDKQCCKCNERFQIGELIVPVFRIVHAGNVHIESTNEPQQWAHMGCLKR